MSTLKHLAKAHSRDIVALKQVAIVCGLKIYTAQKGGYLAPCKTQVLERFAKVRPRDVQFLHRGFAPSLGYLAVRNPVIRPLVRELVEVDMAVAVVVAEVEEEVEVDMVVALQIMIKITKIIGTSKEEEDLAEEVEEEGILDTWEMIIEEIEEVEEEMEETSKIKLIMMKCEI